MKDVTHVSDAVAQHIDKALVQEPHAAETAKEVIDFYLSDHQYTEVHIVKCDKCGANLCLEVLNPNQAGRYRDAHHRGMRRIVLGENGPLLSSRKRLDGLMGYRCMCGNNTIIAEIEKGLLPMAQAPIAHIPTIEPHHEALIKIQMAKNHHVPDIERSADGKYLRQETFHAERLK